MKKNLHLKSFFLPVSVFRLLAKITKSINVSICSVNSSLAWLSSLNSMPGSRCAHISALEQTQFLKKIVYPCYCKPSTCHQFIWHVSPEMGEGATLEGTSRHNCHAWETDLSFYCSWCLLSPPVYDRKLNPADKTKTSLWKQLLWLDYARSPGLLILAACACH